MMVKKKTTGQEGTKQENHIEQIDNEADRNTNYQSATGTEENENPSGMGTETAESTETGSDSPDKVVPDEKSPEEKLAEMQDRYLRLSAEFDNYRKRTLREKIEITKYASENILLSILPLMDDFERAISHLTAATDISSVKEGIDLIYGKFAEFLKQNGVREIESLNCVFNVDIHDAVAKTPVEEEAKRGKIVEVIQKGYYLQDKVIRHSKVVVGE